MRRTESTQGKRKNWYDGRARARTFKPGDKVLVLFPLQSNPLQAWFHGPYVIHSKVSNLNYFVSSLDRRTFRHLCHINMLKPYHDRPMEAVSVVSQQFCESSVWMRSCRMNPLSSLTSFLVNCLTLTYCRALTQNCLSLNLCKETTWSDCPDIQVSRFVSRCSKANSSSHSWRWCGWRPAHQTTPIYNESWEM